MRLILFIILFFAQLSQAETEEFAVIEQLIRPEFKPNSAQILINGDLKNAELISLNDKEFLVLALMPLKTLKEEKGYYSFILKDLNIASEQAHLFSTPFSKIKKLNEIKSYKQKLESKNIILNNRLTELMSVLSKLREQEQTLESELGDKIDLANILHLKAELESLSNSLEFFGDTRTYLTNLLENHIKEPKDIASNSKILSEHLNDAAKVTAAAERLSRSKKETALTKFKQQIKAIEEMQQADLTAMAKQLLELRNSRKKLENSGATEIQNQF